MAYWRTQKYERGVRLVGGRWFGVAMIMGKVGGNFLIFHRKNILKVAFRELLGLSKLLHGHESGQFGSQFVDLTGTSTPVQSLSNRTEPQRMFMPSSVGPEMKGH